MKERTAGEERALVGAVDRALRVLELLSQVEDADLTGLATRAELPKSTVLRLLRTLESHNFVQQDLQTRRYSLGWALIHLGKASERQSKPVRLLRSFLERVSRETGETASLAMLDGNYAVYVDQVLSRNIIRGVPPIGTHLWLHATAVGKALLSALDEERLDRLLREVGLPQITERTIINATRLREDLAVVRKRGYAVDDEEAERGGRCIAAPVRDETGATVAALSITGPTSRIRPDTIDEYAKIVCEVVGQASRLLGYSP
jgi:DNA-binding IclR family transcriptional regulator